MATSVCDENKPPDGKKNENGVSDIDVDDDWSVDSDTSDPLADSDKPSLFCRNCIALYEGEEMQNGNFVLRCTSCDHRDVIPAETLHGTIYSREPELLLGDLLNNRFKRILKVQERLKKIDVQDPDYIDDKFRKYNHLHATISDLMTTKVRDMHVVIDDYRKEHNEKMIETIVDKRTKQLEDGTQSENEVVEVVGTIKDDTIIISPDEFAIPDTVKIKCFRVGKVGIRNADKMVLEQGIQSKYIETMPKFKERYNEYKNKMETAAAFQSRIRRRNRKLARNTNSDTQNWKEKSSAGDIENKNGTELQNVSDIEAEINAVTSETTMSKKKQRKKKCKHKNPYEIVPSNGKIQARIPKLSTEVYLENLPVQKPRPLTLEEQKTFEEQKEISRYVMRDLDDLKDINDFVIGRSSEAFSELVKGLADIRGDALIERRDDTVKYIEETVSTMTSQVDVARNEIIRELKDAYQSKMIRSNRQKKNLEDVTERVEGYKKLLTHYEETGETGEGLDDLLEEFNNRKFDN